jgi:hypothetical protein
VSGIHLESATNFSRSLLDYCLDSFGFVDALSDEKSGLQFSNIAGNRQHSLSQI